MKKRSKILIVDDEDCNLRLMEAILIPLGHEVILARDGEKALEKVREASPDLILLDVIMPKMDGFEVTKKLKESEDTRVIPVVIVTALRETENRVKALEAGADDFLSKPVDRVELRARVNSLLKVKAYNDHMRDYQKKLETEVERKTKQLSRAFKEIRKASLDTIIRLSRAAEYKDKETGNHIQRMSYYAVVLAQKIGLGRKSVEEILYAAPMHDIGKIGIPERILLKRGKLDPDEWTIMKQHPIMGARILEGSNSGFIRVAEVIALTHHERWDGSGYPKGLRCEDIPLVGRIVAICDVIDALVTDRPYRKAFSVEESLKIIAEGRGRQFDPMLVDTFFSLKHEILSIKEKYEDKNESFLIQIVGNEFNGSSVNTRKISKIRS